MIINNESEKILEICRGRISSDRRDVANCVKLLTNRSVSSVVASTDISPVSMDTPKR